MSSMFPIVDGPRTEDASSEARIAEEEDRVQQTTSRQEVEEPQGQRQEFNSFGGVNISPIFSNPGTPSWQQKDLQDIQYEIRRVNFREFPTHIEIPAHILAACRGEGQSNQVPIILTYPYAWANLVEDLSTDTGLFQIRIIELKNKGEYKVYKVRQGKSGKLRTIEEPREDLKTIQRALIPLYEQYPLSPSCTSKRGCSAVQNAARHKDARHLLKVDIKKCYATTTLRHVYKGIKLASSLDSFHTMLSGLTLCVLPYRALFDRILPTGAPTSPMLCNIALTPVDLLVESMLDKDHPGKYTYSRYLDDLIISTTHETRDWDIKRKIEEIIMCGGWAINTKKTRWFTSNKSDKPTVTGVRVGDSYGVPREFHRMVRARLQNLALEGLDIDTKTQGCLSYIKSVDEKKYEQLLAYYRRRVDYESPQTKCTSS